MRSWTRYAGLVAATAALTACSTASSGTSAEPSSPESSATNTRESAGRTSSPAASTPDPRRALHGKVIVVDPGHNGANAAHPAEINEQVNGGGFQKDCNTTGTETDAGYPEHAFNWNVAKRLRRLLEAKGADVVLTRQGDNGVGPCVDDRGKTAARHGADLLLSVHADGGPPNGHGFAVLRQKKVDGYTADTYRDSKLLAHDVAGELDDGGFTRSTYLGSHGIEPRSDLGTLNRADVPAVMVEAGNMRNEQDADLFTSRSGRQRIARALAAGVAAFCVHR